MTLHRDFLRAANMTPAQIRAWATDPRARCASLPRRAKTGRSAVAELDMVARMKTKPFERWTPAEVTKARDLVAFVKRHTKQMGRDVGCRR